MADVGGFAVRRALPQHAHRTVGPWCFIDHLGPVETPPAPPMSIGPHPHMGLHTVTWLFAGEVVHTDSLGSEQPIRPGQLNLMTAGRGVAHAEQAAAGATGTTHAAQLWVAQPEATRNGPAAFEHHAGLPVVEIGPATITVLVGAFGEVVSRARTDSPMVGIELAQARGRAVLGLDATWEHAIVVVEGALAVDGQSIEPGSLAYLAPGRSELTVDAAEPARALILGGAPFGERVQMWWNFVGRSHDDFVEARDEWQAGSQRFGSVRSPLDRIAAPDLV